MGPSLRRGRILVRAWTARGGPSRRTADAVSVPIVNFIQRREQVPARAASGSLGNLSKRCEIRRFPTGALGRRSRKILLCGSALPTQIHIPRDGRNGNRSRKSRRQGSRSQAFAHRALGLSASSVAGEGDLAGKGGAGLTAHGGGAAGLAWLAKPSFRAGRSCRQDRRGMGGELAARRISRCREGQGETHSRHEASRSVARLCRVGPFFGPMDAGRRLLASDHALD